ncbi:MAG TPA: sensor histidine kinase [Streptosporangiaceae bacterium]|jgi:anti-sigma regulatory factor (Ser/Thr protein kinase)
MSAAGATRERNGSGYRHEALLYSGSAEFAAATTSFIRRALAAGGPVLVVVSADKISLLRRELGAAAERVSFADMSEVGANPARIIALWRAFADQHQDAPRLWGIGEPAYPGRTGRELAECQLHEVLLNVAFDPAVPLYLLCPYDLEALAADVIDGAQRAHPYLRQGERGGPSARFRPADLTDPFDRPRQPPPAAAARMAFAPGGLGRLREFVAAQARQAGLDQDQAATLVLAANEVATNSIRHGGGRGELRAWREGRSAVVEVSDQGHITAPLAGRLAPGPAGPGGGLWLANQVCDLVEVYSSAAGSAVRLYLNG